MLKINLIVIFPCYVCYNIDTICFFPTFSMWLIMKNKSKSTNHFQVSSYDSFQHFQFEYSLKMFFYHFYIWKSFILSFKVLKTHVYFSFSILTLLLHTKLKKNERSRVSSLILKCQYIYKWHCILKISSSKNFDEF